MLSFGVTVLPDPPYQRWLELIQLAEQHGFEYAWTYDSHVLWQESIPLLAVAARETSKIKLGHFVTNPAALKCIVGAPSHVTDDLADARDQVRWFPAMVSNHVMDLIERYGTDGSAVPKALTDYVQARKFYDYNDHSRVGAAHGEFVTDEICDRFTVIGNQEQISAKLRELEAVGVDQFNIYLMTHAQEETLAAYGSGIIPQFAGVPA